MLGVCGTLLLGVGLALLGAFLMEVEPLVKAYVPWAGAAATFVGALLLGVRRTPSRGFAVREVALVLSVCGALVLSAAVVVGSRSGWEERILGALLLGAWLQTFGAVVLTLRLALDSERSKTLFACGGTGATVLAIAHGVLIVLGLG